MEGGSYISCIKINGVPILPPMMTKDIREEMSNYKQLAIGLEKKLVALRANKEFKNDNKGIQCKNRVFSSEENIVSLEYKNVHSKESNVTSVGDDSTETLESSNEDIGEALTWNGKLHETVNVDANHYVHVVPATKSGTIETLEIWKPQVPKTLDIIPLTLSNTNSKQDKNCEESDLEGAGDTPKLVRQGSYVLDTPSPILLAHMQMELASSACTPCLEYIPTSCTNTARRKEWNIAQAKIEWEHESKHRDSVPLESQECLLKHERNSQSSGNRKVRKSMSLQMKSKSSCITCPSTRSVDCIQTMLAKEYTDCRTAQVNHSERYAANNSSEKKRKFQKWEKCNSFSPFNSTYRPGGSLENLVHDDVPCSKHAEYKYTQIRTGNGLPNETSKSTEIQDSVSKLKTTIASDKLLIVYKKVQEMHKKQMAELVSRQQREQTMLQKEFEKQQLLLLNEIRKSFPEISEPLLPENILSPTFNGISPDSEKLPCDASQNTDNNTQYIENLRNSFQQENRGEYLQDNNTNKLPCPLDYICPEIDYHSSMKSYPTKYSNLHQTSEAVSPCKISDSVITVEQKEMQMRGHSIEHDEKKVVEENDGNKRSNVSRQLFPLDSKTTHVPILDRPLYEAKHIEAASVINAYARGYLVRRLMRTERVISLKNTYKEALHCMLKLHVDAPLNRSEFNFLHRLQLQCDAASMNIVELFAQSPEKRMQVIAQDREIKQSRIERPTSARSYSFATQRTLARKKLKEMEEYPPSSFARSCTSRSRCQTWTSDIKEKLISPNVLYQGIKRSTSAGTMRKPWR